PYALRAQAVNPPWPYQCGDGRVDTVIDNFDQVSPWTYCCSFPPAIAPATLSSIQGCSGNALAINFDITGGDWIIVLRNFNPPVDLSKYTHLRLPMRGSNLNAHHNVEVKLFDGKGLYVATLTSITDLPDWRPLYIDFREFNCDPCG